MNEPLQQTLVDIARLLELEGIQYALIGGLAASILGQPRVTADVDLVILADVERSLRLAASLDATAFRPLFPDVSDVVEKAFILPLRHRVTNVKVDLAIGLSGFEQQVVRRAKATNMGAARVTVATPEDLLLMKALAGRAQDDQDIQGLLIVQGARVDWDYCLALAADLGEALGQDLVGRIAALRQGLSDLP